jgi:hypothetical protein
MKCQEAIRVGADFSVCPDDDMADRVAQETDGTINLADPNAIASKKISGICCCHRRCGRHCGGRE